MVSFVLLVTPFNEPEMLATVLVETFTVLTVKVTDALPLGIVTEPGTLAACWSLPI